MSWNIREVRVPTLSPVQAQWVESVWPDEELPLNIEHKVVAVWQGRGTNAWPTPEEVMEVIYQIRRDYASIREEDIVIHGRWPKSGDVFAGITIP